MAYDGSVRRWTYGRGFGFIDYETDNGDKASVFVHARELKYGRRVLEEGERVSFDIIDDPAKPGSLQATDVQGEYRDDPPDPPK